MVISSTSAVDVSIHAVSPALMVAALTSVGVVIAGGLDDVTAVVDDTNGTEGMVISVLLPDAGAGCSICPEAGAEPRQNSKPNSMKGVDRECIFIRDP
jgi:hypothetical protein